ncbi:cbb3-type cytochrome c oxidase N-terminal domain-containing protein [Seonamhaeicola marinus]|uniref:C-type cytochrome n=1 Tax=Seonamhaeicola marinus TaxID=1912246 RepID=A0A5D0JEJ4_9FLAO|nr:cbb3-type cytochrome c oxidase N-terminal domain-containing protein [Seonamhaeicola marinus]TYA92312.1 c-type cytochrome [Seonamhaeicola marinus]
MRKLFPSWVRVPVVFFIIFGVVEFFIDSGEKPAFIEYPVVLLFLFLVLLILIAIEAIVGALENVMLHKMDEEAKARFLADKEKSYQFTWFKKTYNKLLDQKPIEEEGEIVLDHNYDGIRELDNNLPPWWLWGFYISIVFAAIYLVRFHILDGPGQIDELETELAEAKTAIEEYKKTAKDLVDINTVTLLTDASDLNAGKEVFNTNCVACHMADGGGGIGPNLTDQHWILGGGIKNVFKTVSEGGRSGKGMIAWKAQLKPSQIAQVASYVLSLQGTTPANPKAPEGDIWVDENATEETTTETTE